MAKYNKRVVEQICQLISSDSYTVDEICTRVGISRSAFFRWKRENGTFGTALKEAKQAFDAVMIAEARKSLRKKITGFDVEEMRVVLGRAKDGEKPQIKEKTITKKHIAPDTTALIFFLSNKLPEEFKNRQQIDAKVDMEKRLQGLSDQDLDEVISAVLSKSQSNGNE